MTYATAEYATAEWSAEGAAGGPPLVVATVALTESGDDIFASTSVAVPHPIATTAALTSKRRERNSAQAQRRPKQ